MTKPGFIDSIRSDISNWLIHCTQDIDNVSAFDNLKTIISQKSLQGSSKLIKSGCNCICFSEAPLTKIKSLTLYCDRVPSNIRYAPFGVAVKKEWLFLQGGRPVIFRI
jgi:hypothetical protein